MLTWENGDNLPKFYAYIECKLAAKMLLESNQSVINGLGSQEPF